MKVGIIGAGLSGLVAAKELKAAGFDFQIFDKSEDLGGVFRYTKEAGGVYDSTLLTISNYFMAFSDFPPKEAERRFWTHEEYFQYLKDYAKHFGIEENIQYNTDVFSVKIREDQKVEVKTRTGADQHEETLVFDHVVVSSGTHQTPKLPDFKGRDRFRGEIQHSTIYKNNENYAGKSVVCVGLGETAADVVYEISCVSKKCILSIRRKHYIVPRYFPELSHDRITKGVATTTDALTSRFNYQILGQKGWDALISKVMFWAQGSKDPVGKCLADWTLDTKYWHNMFFTKNEIFMKGIVEGNVKVNHSGIREIYDNTVVFNDGEKEDDIDIIMCNTGYTDKFGFLKDKEISDIKDLYKHMIDPDLREKIVFIGFARPAEGNVPACSELQARYFVTLLQSKAKLPPGSEFVKLIQKEKAVEENEFYFSPTPRALVRYSVYADSLAKLIGCYPVRLSLITKPKLLRKVLFGSQLSFQYRIHQGDAVAEKAREVILKLPAPLYHLYLEAKPSVTERIVNFTRMLRMLLTSHVYPFTSVNFKKMGKERPSSSKR